MSEFNQIHWFPGHMMKTLRSIEAELKNVDFVIELLDARIPLSSKNPELSHIKDRKPHLLVLNKSDLADDAITDRFIKYYKDSGYGAVKACSKNKKSAASAIESGFDRGSEIIKKYREKGMTGAKPRAMIIGIPNVGKSTFINTLSGKAPAKAENRPGVTRGKQWVSLGDVELLDMPGVLWRRFETPDVALKLAFIGSVKDDILDKEEIASCLALALADIYPQRLCERYKLDDISELPQSGYELLELIAKKRGMLVSKGEYDIQRAACVLLEELRNGKLGPVTFEQPPAVDTDAV